MTDLTRYFHIQPATMEPCTLSQASPGGEQADWYCGSCLIPKPRFMRIDARIEEAIPSDPPLSFVDGGPGIIEDSLLCQLDTVVVARDLFLGRLFDSRGIQISGWHTFRGRHRLIVRGDKHVAYRKCSECGRSIYFAMGKRYLFPAPPDNADIFESDIYGLILREPMFAKLDMSGFMNVSLDVLQVPDEPRDSLGANL
jgi:hypothetical protein